MTRQVSKDSISALLTGHNKTVSNTSVIDNKLYLFGNNIIKIEDGDVFVRLVVNSVTTRERLNTLSNYGYNITVVQRKGIPFINGKAVNDLYEWHKISKV